MLIYIDHTGARLMNKLEELILTGNHLRNEGVKVVLNGVSVAKELKKIYLGDN